MSKTFTISFMWYTKACPWSWFNPSSANNDEYRAYDAHFGYLSVYFTFMEN